MEYNILLFIIIIKLTFYYIRLNKKKSVLKQLTV
jgi:hypothetical protein